MLWFGGVLAVVVIAFAEDAVVVVGVVVVGCVVRVALVCDVYVVGVGTGSVGVVVVCVWYGDVVDCVRFICTVVVIDYAVVITVGVWCYCCYCGCCHLCCCCCCCCCRQYR